MSAFVQLSVDNQYEQDMFMSKNLLLQMGHKEQLWLIGRSEYQPMGTMINFFMHQSCSLVV